MNSYPVQDERPLRVIAFLQSKMNISLALKPKLTIPICMLGFMILSKESSRREHLFDEMNHCTETGQLQMVLLCLLMGGTLLSQFLSPERKPTILRAVQLACPLTIFAWVVWI